MHSEIIKNAYCVSPNLIDESGLLAAGFVEPCEIYRMWGGAKRPKGKERIIHSDGRLTVVFGYAFEPTFRVVAEFAGFPDLVEYVERTGEVKESGANVWD